MPGPLSPQAQSKGLGTFDVENRSQGGSKPALTRSGEGISFHSFNKYLSSVLYLPGPEPEPVTEAGSGSETLTQDRTLGPCETGKSSGLGWAVALQAACRELTPSLWNQMDPDSHVSSATFVMCGPSLSTSPRLHK